MLDTRRRFTQQEYEDRQQRTRNAMQNRGIDVLIVTDPGNMYWLTGYDGWSFYVHQCVVISSDGGLFWYGRCIDAAGARLTTDLAPADIIDYADSYVHATDCHPMDYLSEQLKQRRYQSAKIGLEKDSYYFSASAAESLYRHLPDAEFIDATNLVNWQRAVKSDTEIGYMKKAGKVIESVYQRIRQLDVAGLRKNDLVAEILHAGVTGTDDIYGDYTAIVPLIGVGKEASACHMTWDGEKIGTNTGMFLELAAAHARYHCPCSRTLYVGKPDQKYLDVEKVMQECMEITIDKFVPGNTCGEVASTFFNHLKKNGYEKDNRCGYSIGVAYPPDWGEHTMSLRATDRTVLQEGMCFHFMPGLWFEDWGFELTEALVVREKGGECLSSVPRELFVSD
jgi:ectoine hydrolase